jgi:hypothetical protein
MNKTVPILTRINKGFGVLERNFMCGGKLVVFQIERCA